MITIRSCEVLADARSAGWLEQELHPDLDRHRRHQMADICEGENAERVWRVLGAAEAEVRMALLRILRPESETGTANELERPEAWNFSFLFELPTATVGFLREKIHEYLVDRVIAERAGVIIPGCAGIWSERATEALAALRAAAATARPPHTAVRRPLWPIFNT